VTVDRPAPTANSKPPIEVTPILPVSAMPETIAFYEAAGFEVNPYDDKYAFVNYGDQPVFDLGLSDDLDPATNRAAVFIVVIDADAWHARLSEHQLPVSAIENMPWGMREFTLSDPSGNRLRIGNPI
jgi:hypothetical protein